MTEQLTSAEVAAKLGITPDTWRAYVTRGQAPPADGRLARTNWWRPETIEEWQANRPGPGARTDLRKKVENSSETT